jgi:hypothetical protein
MKNGMYTFVLLLLCISSSSQNVLFLKSGERMAGKIVRLRSDTLTFSFKGANLNLKTAEVLAIYFDEKVAPKDLRNQSVQVSNIVPSEGKINGVITYYFNQNYGDKPDVGAEVYIVDSSETEGFNIGTIDSFYNGNIYRSLANSYISIDGKVPSDVSAKLEKYGVAKKNDFDSLDLRTAKSLIHIEDNKTTIKTVVDGSGNYSVSLKPGTYYVYIKSNNRKEISITEISGLIYWKKVVVKPNEVINVSHNFRN